MSLLLDIDGTVLDAGRPLPGAIDAIDTIRSRGVKLLFATNTSRKSRADVAASLNEAGVKTEESEILSAGYAAAVFLETAGVRRVQLLLTESARADWEGFEITDDEPEVVVVGDMGADFTFEILNAGFRSLHAGARLVATQKNRYWKSADGWTLDAGAFVAGLEYSARKEAEIVGKPAIGFFRMAARLLGDDPRELTIVGDDIESDIAGGRAAGLKTCLVKTGKYDPDRVAAAPAWASPDRILDSIADVVSLIG